MESRVKESDITINDGTASWSLVHHGALGGTYMGLFRFRCFMTPLQTLEADRDFRELLGPNAAFAATNSENIAYSLAQLKQRILEAPPFWMENATRYGGGGLKDLEVLDLVLEAAVVAELKYRKEIADRHQDAIKRIQKTMDKRLEEEKINAEFAEKAKKSN